MVMSEHATTVAKGPSEALPLHADRPPLRVDEGGAVRVGNSRITLDLIVEQYENGMTPEDLVRAQDALSEGTPDHKILAWAPAENRVLITNDRNTMVGFAYRRVAAGEPLPGLIATTNQQSIGSAIDDILLIAEYVPEEEVR